MTSVLQSQLDTWPKAVLGQHCWSLQEGVHLSAYPVLAQQDKLSLCQFEQQLATFQVAGWSLIWLERAATSAP